MAYRVCFIENDERVLKIHADFIHISPPLSCPPECRFTHSAPALQQIPNLAPAVIVVDLELGKNGPSGKDCIAKLSDLLPSTPIIVYTLHSDAEWIFPALRSGASGYILKDSPADLVSQLVKVCQGDPQPPLSSAICRKMLEFFQTGDQKLLGRLSQREMAVLQLLSKGVPRKEIASKLRISVKSIDNALAAARKNLSAVSRDEVIAKFAVIEKRC